MSAEKALVIDLKNEGQHQTLLDGRPQTHGMRSGRVILQPGQDCGEHTTGPCEEMLVFLAGQGKVSVGSDEVVGVGKGRVYYIPPNTTHNVRNDGADPLVYVYCVAPVETRVGDDG